MSEVKRYDYDWRHEEMVYCEDGYYVLHSDYEKLKARLEKAETVIRFYSKDGSVTATDQNGYRYDIALEENNDISSDCSVGAKAREYFKEKE